MIGNADHPACDMFRPPADITDILIFRLFTLLILTGDGRFIPIFLCDLSIIIFAHEFHSYIKI